MNELHTKAEKLKKTALTLPMRTEAEKNDALLKIAHMLREKKATILQENQKDIAAGKKAGLSSALLDRLLLTEERIEQMAEGVHQLITLKDPIGEVIETWERPNGLSIQTVRVPLGVVGMVYEARPNVTVDAACICLKAGNAVFLRGSASALHSNIALVQVMQTALADSSIPIDAIQLLEDTSRETANEMFQLHEYLDVLIPRGGAGLIQAVLKHATIPVIETGVGNCHLYIDASAQKEMAVNIALNAKTQRPSVCNAIETVIIHKDWPHTDTLLAAMQQNNIELRVDERFKISFDYQKATEIDWRTEYLDTCLAVKQAKSVQEAIEHINEYGTKHSEAIISEDDNNVRLFFQAVDAAVLYHNASTRFTDGEQFGYGAEIGISTQKLHARGPMGLRALTAVKTIIEGQGQIRN